MRRSWRILGHVRRAILKPLRADAIRRPALTKYTQAFPDAAEPNIAESLPRMPEPRLRETAQLRIQGILLFALLAGASTIAYLPAIQGGFIFDDEILLTHNNLVKAGDGLFRIWFTTEPIDYWPITNTSFWIEWRLWGMNPTGYHVTNLFLHVADSLLVWLVLRRLRIPGAFLAGLLFAVHPVNVESVAWIAQRKNLLAMLFFLTAILLYLRSDNSLCRAESPRTSRMTAVWYLLSLLAFLLAMLSKGSVAILPLILLFVIWWIRGRLGSRDFAKMLPFLVLGTILVLVNIWFQSHGSGDPIRSASWAERLAGAGAVVWFYLYKALAPLNLMFNYPQWDIRTNQIRWWLPLFAMVAVTIFLGVFRQHVWRKPLLFAWAYFCIALLPVVGFVDVYFMKYSLVADHYQHIALVAVVALLAAFLTKMWSQATTFGRPLVGSTTFLLVAALGLLTWQHSKVYASAIVLYSKAFEKNPRSWLAANNLGSELVQIGEPDDAIQYLRRAIELKPDYVQAYYNLGTALTVTGHYDEAVRNFRRALELQPDYMPGRHNLGLVLQRLGSLEEALAEFNATLPADDEVLQANFNVGNVLVKLGQPREAIAYYRNAIILQPELAQAHFNLANTLASLGETNEAIESYQQAIRFKTDYAEAHFNLANLFLNSGRPEEAVDRYLAALRAEPGYAEACANLAGAYASLGNRNDAIAAAERSIAMARTSGKTELVNEVSNWLISYQRQDAAEPRKRIPSLSPPEN
jgi:protein O-mannosyl-transferase